MAHGLPVQPCFLEAVVLFLLRSESGMIRAEQERISSSCFVGPFISSFASRVHHSWPVDNVNANAYRNHIAALSDHAQLRTLILR
jgi:hypothetical protein